MKRLSESGGRDRLRVRCSAAGHSSSQVAETVDFLIVTDKLQTKHYHRGTNFITMEAGNRLSD
jgi:hypothetical protein